VLHERAAGLAVDPHGHGLAAPRARDLDLVAHGFCPLGAAYAGFGRVSTMKRALFSILVVLGGCGGSTAEDKPTTPKATATPEAKAKAAETKVAAEGKA